MTILIGDMRIKYLSHHAKEERGKCRGRNENETKYPAIVSSCQLKDMRNCNSSACQRVLEENLCHKLEETRGLYSHSGEFESEEDCADQKRVDHQAQTVEEQVYYLVT
jgi:hypothetical protein